MRLTTALLIAAGSALTLAPSVASAQVYSLTSSIETTAYTQNFNTLPSSSSITVTSGNLNAHNAALNGWYFLENVGNTTLTAGTGSSTTADTYSFGATSNTDRALGGLTSNALNPSWGFYFTNNTGATLTSLTISYQGEVWRVGATGRADRVDFSYSLDATTLANASGTWVNVDALDFSSTSAVAIASGSMLQSGTVTSTISGLSLSNGSSMFIRWVDANITGNDDGIGIDDFSLTATLQALVTGNYWAPGVGGGGAGTWSSASATWSETSGTQGTASQATTGALVFGGTGGAITVSGTVTANAGLTFSADAYALTGGTITLGGADAAANTITTDTAVGTSISSALSAVNGLTKAGNGTLTLGGSNSGLGAVAVSAGTLKLSGASALGSTASGTSVAAGATLDLNGQTVGAEALALSGTLANSSASAASLAGLVTVSGSAAISTTGNLTLSGGTTGSGFLTKSGNGTLTLTGSTGHTGGTSVSAGTLATSGSGTLTGHVTLASGTTLTLAGATTLDSLSAGDSALNLTFGGALSATTLTLDGTLNLSLTGLGAAPAAGTYQVLSFSSLAGTGSINFSQSLAGYDIVGTLGLDNYSVAITLLAKSLSWSGSSGTWSVGGGNWTNDSTTGAETFTNGDSVTFGSGGEGGTGGSITVGEGVTFGSLTFTSDSLNYGFAGAGLAGAGTVTLNGAATVAFNNANTFTGAVVVNRGSLVVGDALGLGSTDAGTTVAAGAEMYLGNGITVTGEALTLGGALRGFGGTNTFAGAITLSGDASLSTTVDWGTLNITGSISGGGHALSVNGDGAVNLSGGLVAASLAKSGTGTLTLSAGSSLSGTTLDAGTINFNQANALGNGTVTINGGALGNTSGSAKTLANAIAVGGDFALGTAASNGDLTLSGAVDLGNATRTVSVTGTQTLSGAVTNGSLTKTGNGTLTLSGSNTLGGLAVATGTLRMGSAGALGGSSVTVDSAATLELNGQNATLTSLSGAGTVANGGAANSTLTLNIASAATVSTAFADGLGGGKLGLTKSGNGALTLSVASTNSGAVAINAGSVIAGATGALGTGAVTLAGGTSLIAGGSTVHANNLTVPAPAAGGFIISEYVEGTSNNKYIELYNGTNAAIDLTQYQIRLYDNGKNAATAAAGVVISTFTGGLTQLASGATLVLRNPSAPTANTPGVTTYSATGITFFNGDDTFALERTDGTTVDIFGVIGSDPGTAWTVGSNTTLDRTLVRNSNVLSGVSTNPAGSGITGFATLGSEWTSYATDTFSNLGSHTMNLPVGGDGAVTLGVADIDSSATFSGTIALGNGANLTAASGSTATFSGTISGAGALTKVGEGRVVLSGANTFSGGITVSAGTLEAAYSGALGSGTVTLSGGTLDLGGLDVAGTIALGAGTLANASGLTSAATLLVGSGSSLTFSTLGAYGLANVTLSGGTLDLNSLNPDNVITYVSGSFLNAANWNGTVAPSGTGDVTDAIASLTDAGLSVQVGSGQSVNLSDARIKDKDIVVNGASVNGLSGFNGKLAVAAGSVDFSGVIGFAGSVEVRGGSVNFGSAISDIAITYRGGSVTGANYSGTVTVGSGVSLDLASGAIAAGATVRSGSGATVNAAGGSNALVYAGGSVSGLDTFAGALTVESAKLVQNGLINTNVTLASGGALGGNAQINGDLVQADGSILAPGNSPGTALIGGNHVLAAGATFQMEVLNLGDAFNPPVAGTDHDTVNVIGTLNLGGLDTFNRYIIQLTSIDGANANATATGFLADQAFQLVLFTFGTIDLGANESLVDLFDVRTTTANFAFLGEDGSTPVDASLFNVYQDGNTVVLAYAPIPEPSTYGLILGGLALAGAAVRRRRAGKNSK